MTSVVRSDLARSRCLETLANLALRHNVSIDENRVRDLLNPDTLWLSIVQIVGTWLIQLLTPPSPKALQPEMFVTVLNAIIDIYADEGREYDRPVFVEGGFLEALAAVVGRVRNEVNDRILILGQWLI